MDVTSHDRSRRARRAHDLHTCSLLYSPWKPPAVATFAAATGFEGSVHEFPDTAARLYSA